MAVNMNEPDCLQLLFFVLLIVSSFQGSFSTTTDAASGVTTETTSQSNVEITENTTTPIPTTNSTSTTTTSTTSTTTTTTIAPLQPPSVLDPNSLIGLCPCDLTGNACDVNCCCDEDCTADDKKTFSLCLPFSADVDDRLCFRKEIILFENSDPIISSITDDGLFCIYYDNKKERNYYTNPSLVRTLEAFEDYRREFPVFSFQSNPPVAVAFDSAFYKMGDPIYTVFESQAIGVLGLPRTLTTVDCVDGNPAAYLTNEKYTCVRTIENLTQVCQEGSPGFDANNFLDGFRVVTSPQMFQEFNVTMPGTADFYSLYNNSFTIAVELDGTTDVDPIQCFDTDSGLTTSCNYSTLPHPTRSPSACTNVLQQVHYRLITDGTEGITRVLARFVLFNLVDSVSSGYKCTQSFSISFEAVRSESPFERSGNPGYVEGQPVLAGTLNQTTVGETITDRILINENRDKYMTVVRSSASGDCFADSDNRISVVFGRNIRTGCLLRVSAANRTQYCALMQQKIIETLEFDSVPEAIQNGFRHNNRYVGLYGNSDVSKTGDWVEILYQNRLPPSNPLSGSSSCRLSLGMHVQILYANIGALINPQAKIIGVSFIYDSPTTIQIRPTLSGEYNQPVEVTASVAFIDVSKAAVGYQGEPPLFIAKVPFDFFYPFISDASIAKPLIFDILPIMTLIFIFC